MSTSPTLLEQLYPRRLAGRALALALDAHDLGAVTLKLNPDDLAHCLPGAVAGEMLFGLDLVSHGSPTAWVYLEGSSARVIVEEVERLIRPNHVAGLDLEDLGIRRRPGWPDIDATVDLTEVIATEGELLRTAPLRRTPQKGWPYQKPRVVTCGSAARRG